MVNNLKEWARRRPSYLCESKRQPSSPAAVPDSYKTFALLAPLPAPFNSEGQRSVFNWGDNYQSLCPALQANVFQKKENVSRMKIYPVKCGAY